MKPAPQLALIVPCYNEAAVLIETAKQLLALLNALITKAKITAGSFILFIDDGSQDNSWLIISELQQQFSAIRGIKLSRNFGHQAALYCGLHTVATLPVDCAISLDADLQDEVALLEQFIDHYQAGSNIVYGVRKTRTQDSIYKKTTAWLFYKLMQIMGTPLIHNHADYRLLNRQVLQNLTQFTEANLFLRGIIPCQGYHSSKIYYARNPRQAGKTKYTISRMFNLALTGITAFSVLPLRLISVVGATTLLITSILIITFIHIEFFQQHHIPRSLLILILIYFMGSIQLLSLGFLGEYLGKIYLETKARPKYLIKNKDL